MNFIKTIYFYRKRINNILNNIINNLKIEKKSVLLKAIKYSILNGGNRTRPILVYIIGNMFGAHLVNLDINAAAIECIHTYSLIHDDLPSIDNDHLRRGIPSCHIKFGEDIAILAGNTLQSLAVSILSNKPMKNINSKTRLLMISELSHASGIEGICQGQSLDLTSYKKSINIKKLNKIYRLKTGSLIKTAVRLGFIASDNKKNKIINILDKYSKYVGLGFQIKNDVLDIIGSTNITGKKIGSDEKLKKITYPTIIGIKQSKLKIIYFYNIAISILDKINKYSINTDILKKFTHLIMRIDK